MESGVKIEAETQTYAETRPAENASRQLAFC